jgi:hypothetical protein
MYANLSAHTKTNYSTHFNAIPANYTTVKSTVYNSISATSFNPDISAIKPANNSTIVGAFHPTNPSAIYLSKLAAKCFTVISTNQSAILSTNNNTIFNAYFVSKHSTYGETIKSTFHCSLNTTNTAAK